MSIDTCQYVRRILIEEVSGGLRLCFAKTTSECNRLIPQSTEGTAIELISSKTSSKGAIFILRGGPTWLTGMWYRSAWSSILLSESKLGNSWLEVRAWTSSLVMSRSFFQDSTDVRFV